MVWCPLTWLFANFARVFRSGIALLIIVPYAMFPDLEWKEGDTYEYRVRRIVCSTWLFSFSLFAGTNYAQFCNVVRDKKIQMPRDQRIWNLRIGAVGLLICAIVQLVACIYMKANDGIGHRYMIYAHCAAILFVGLYTLEQSYMCKLPNRYGKIHHYMMTFIALCGINSFYLTGVNRFEIAGYMHIIGTLLVDGYILFFHSSEIYFLKEFIEKQVVCKDKHGNEWRGHFASVDVDFKQELYLRLFLTDAKFTREDRRASGTAEGWYIDEIESLELAVVESSRDSIEKKSKRNKKKIA